MSDDWTRRNPGMDDEFYVDDTTKKRTRRVYAGLAPHPTKAGYVAWLVKQPDVQATGARKLDAMESLFHHPRVVGVAVRYVEDLSVPKGVGR